MSPHARASAIVLALEAIDASTAGEDEHRAAARRLVTADFVPDLHAGADLHVHHVCAMRDALLTACAVHSAMLVGVKWEPMGEPWEDRDGTRHHVARLTDWFLDAIHTAMACGVTAIVRHEEATR